MEIYCFHCKLKTNTKGLHFEEKTLQTKSGNSVHRTLAKGQCAVCGTNKGQFVTSGSHSTSKTLSNSKETKPKQFRQSKQAKQLKEQNEPVTVTKGNGNGEGLKNNMFLADKKIISKHTYNALKHIAETSQPGRLTIDGKLFKIKPHHVEKLKNAHKHNALKKVSKVLSGEKKPHEVLKSGSGNDHEVIADTLSSLNIS